VNRLPTDDGAGRRREVPMSFRSLTMIDVKEVLRRWQATQSARQIACETGYDRKTVGRYVEAAEQCALPRDRKLSDEEVHEVAQRVQARPLLDRSTEWNEVEQQRDRIAAWLSGHRPLKLRKVHTLLKREGMQATYWTLRRFVIKQLGWGKPCTTVLIDDPPPGQEAQVDFGRMGMIHDEHSGRRRMLWALIITLGFSRLSFVWPTFRQTTEAIIEGLEAAWKLFDGVPHTLIPDNPTTMIICPDPISARLNEVFADYVQARDVWVDPARPGRARDKPKVENAVPYVRESWFDGEHFTGLEQARQSARDWCWEIAGTRVHGTTRKLPREVYETIEKPHMLVAPQQRYDVPTFGDPKVHPDYHIQMLNALYSVPYPYVHRKVHVRADSVLVKIFFATELIKVHPRQPPGGRSTDVTDYPPGKSLYATRSIDGMLRKARERGVHIGIFVERILQGPLPWSRMRAAYALLRLCDKYGEGRVESVCQSALSFDVVDVHRVSKMLKRATAPRARDADGKVVQLPLPLATPRFARDPKHFATRSPVRGKEGV